MLISLAEAAEIAGVSRPAMTQLKKRPNAPNFFVEDERGKVRVDDQSAEWKLYLVNRKGNSTGPKSKRTKPVKSPARKPGTKKPTDKKPATKKPTPAAGKPSKPSKLEQEATEAKFRDIILNSQIRHFNFELAKKAAMEKAGDLFEREVMDRLYRGYMERCNLLLMGISKKLDPLVRGLVDEKDPAQIIEMYDKEIKSVLILIAREQAKEVEEWKAQL